jgi:DNA-binding NtrC family response regulator/cytochrome b subunit of formate dehydrogenase
MAGERVLILEDDALLASVLVQRFQSEGWDAVATGTLAAARTELDGQGCDVALFDLRLPDGESLELLREFIPRSQAVFVMMTAHGTVGSAVEALKLGAKDYLEKPFSLDRAVATVRRALELTAMRRELAALRDRCSVAGTSVIGESQAMRDVFGLIERLAAADAATVLIEGESGTGKGAIAQALHRLGRRARGPFVNVTCAALPETLMESELFGHERGAFTDAHSAKRGLVEMADGGTLFLDEIGELTPGVQAKLLRFIEEKTFRRLGGTKDLTVDVRIMTATNRDLTAEVAAGRFRPDLYYRLRVVPIVMPPLRGRGGDIPLLAKHFATEFATEFAKRIAGIGAEAMKLLAAYAWPGNVRELRNVMERAVLLADGDTIGVKELPPEIALPRAALAALPQAAAVAAAVSGNNLDEVERSLVAGALERTRGNQSKAARILGVSRHRFRTLMKRYGVAGALLLALLVPASLWGQARPVRSPCLLCHGDRELLARRALPGVDVESLLVDPVALGGSVHRAVACERCHPLHERWPHPEQVRRAIPCGTCHAAVDSLWGQGAHGASRKRGAECFACHGTHDVAPAAQLRRGGALAAAMDSTCVGCHAARGLAENDVHRGRATCASCHGAHRVASPQRAEWFATGCGTCHEAITREAATDVHGAAVRDAAAGKALPHGVAAPTCVACHGGHGILPASAFARDSMVAARCAGCHAQAARSYGDTYHGNAAKVGSKTAARCVHCHGSHQIYPSSDARSKTSEGQLAHTCAQCHEPAKNAGLTSYRVHVEKENPKDSRIVFASWAFMLLLVVGTIGFFGLHTALWLSRSVVERLHARRWRRQQGLPDPPKRRVPMDSADRGKGPYVWRFSLLQRVAHGLTVIAFFSLTITGLPLRFSCAIWAPWLMQVIGGVTVAGLIHRIAGSILVLNFVGHITQVTVKIFRSPNWKSHFWGPDSLIPQPRDAVQMLQMFKYFFGLGPKPRFGRWGYMEKFDYFGSFWGVFLLGVTGFVRWFPGLFASWMPGWGYNVAAVFHAEEALLAASFLFLVHFFNVHLRPDRFPLDGTMWTGRARLEVFEEEHPELAAQWSGLESQPVSVRPVADRPAPPPPPWLTITGAAFGIFAAAVGIAILGLILWVQLC